MAAAAAQDYRVLRSKGVTVCKTIYVLIGTFRIENCFSLIRNGRDFDPMEKFLGLSALREWLSVTATNTGKIVLIVKQKNEKDLRYFAVSPRFYLVPRAGLEPARP